MPEPSSTLERSSEAPSAGPALGLGLLMANLPGPRLLRRRFNLTPREAEAARLIALRLTNREVAEVLGVSVHTARRHTERTFRKLGVGSRRDVLRAITRASEPSPLN